MFENKKMIEMMKLMEQIYIDKERATKLSIDPEERGGLSLFGTKEAIKNSLLNT